MFKALDVEWLSDDAAELLTTLSTVAPHVAQQFLDSCKPTKVAKTAIRDGIRKSEQILLEGIQSPRDRLAP